MEPFMYMQWPTQIVVLVKVDLPTCQFGVCIVVKQRVNICHHVVEQDLSYMFHLDSIHRNDIDEIGL